MFWKNKIRTFSNNSKLFLFLLLCAPVALSAQTNPPTILCVTTLSSGDVTINWSPPLLSACGVFNAYVLLGATNTGGSYLTIDTITNQAQTSVVHAGANATILDWHYFMVTICSGTASAPSDTVTEELLLTPVIDYVTVEPGGVRLTWFPSASSQTAGYVIYYASDTGFATAFDTVYGRTTDFYIDVAANPDAGSVAYTVAAFDGCGNNTPFNDSSHHTVFLRDPSIIPCQQEVLLNWTRYLRWSAIDSYNIEISTDNSPFTVGKSFPDGNYGWTYSLAGIAADTICFRISAVRQGDNVTSYSNVVCFPYNLTRPTAFNYLRNVSVNTTGGVDLEWYIDTAAEVNNFTIERSTDGNSFSSAAAIPVSDPPLLNPYTDASAPASSGSLYYRVISDDNCDFSLSSSPGRTIFLSGVNNPTFNALSWNAFELEYATVLNYTVYRVENNILVPDTTLPPTARSHEDFIVSDLTSDGTFCYVVEATFDLAIPGFAGETLQSFSNQFCLYPPPVVTVPNAFVPDGKNNVFKPTLQNPNVAEYKFMVFDRWGKKIFETGEVNVGWDGSHNGERLPFGGYAYYVRVVSLGGVAAENKGTVVLVR